MNMYKMYKDVNKKQHDKRNAAETEHYDGIMAKKQVTRQWTSQNESIKHNTMPNLRPSAVNKSSSPSNYTLTTTLTLQ